jgi:hypothetical protein
MTIVTYPPNKQPEVQNKYFDIFNKYPYDESVAKRLVRMGVRTTNDGYEVISIHDIPDGKYKEAFNNSVAVMHEYSAIEGFRGEIRTYLSGEEAFKIIGKKLPE